MAYGTINADLMTTSDGVSSSGLYGFKNRIINGAMVIDQRNAGASVSASAGGYTLDRWMIEISQVNKFTYQQNAGSVTPPAGFTNYLGITSSSAYTVVASDYFALEQRIEGFNTADLDFGKSTAKTITLSFWVRSSLTGTFGGAFGNSAGNRSYPFTYTISAANTWEQKSVTIAGDTTGTWLTTNGAGLVVYFSLGMGSNYTGTAGAWNSDLDFSATGATSVVGTNGATFYITGVQLEKGSTATSFDYRSYSAELAMCQRYFYKKTGALYQTFGGGYGDTTARAVIQLYNPVEMRSTPTMAIGGTLRLIPADLTVSSIGNAQMGVASGYISINTSGATDLRPYLLGANNDTTAFLSGSSEL